MPEHPTPTQQLTHLKKLQDELQAAYTTGLTSGDGQRFDELRAEFEEKEAALRAVLAPGRLDADQMERVIAATSIFLQDTFTKWYDADTGDTANITHPVLVTPPGLDYTNKKADSNPNRFGEYTLNPDTQGLNFEKAEVFIPDLSQFNGRSL
ncbi:hypothetical protein HY413_00110, partial [Candidatus Kaiserbacteria bacterium]|nr:hypothetical protein [Candidatus Kaiserbacteria bacterium]